MTITQLPVSSAPVLAPLLKQLHDFHVAREPELMFPTPPHSVLEAHLCDLLGRENFAALIAGPETAPTGYLLYEIEYREGSVLTRPETRAMLHHICVDQDHRRKGIGSALIDELKVRARRRGVDRIGTTYALYNTISAKLMTANGLAPRRAYATVEFEDL